MNKFTVTLLLIITSLALSAKDGQKQKVDIETIKERNTRIFHKIGYKPIAKTATLFIDALFDGKPNRAFVVMKKNPSFPLQGIGTIEDIENLELDRYRILTYDLKAYKQLSSKSGILFYTANTKNSGPIFIELGFYFSNKVLHVASFSLNTDFDDAVKTLNIYDELEAVISFPSR